MQTSNRAFNRTCLINWPSTCFPRTLRKAQSLVQTRGAIPSCRDEVLVSYEYRCAMCGIDPQIDNVPVGSWTLHMFAGGRLVVQTLSRTASACAPYITSYLTGVSWDSISTRVILVSDRFRGSSAFAQQMVLNLVGQGLRPPQPGRVLVDSIHITWHPRGSLSRESRGGGGKEGAGPSCLIAGARGAI